MDLLKGARPSRDSITDQTYNDLRRAIITGKIAPGTRLVESTLAEEMGVSRTPIREALRQLSIEGLLYIIPRAGYVVEELTERDIQDLFETRAAIEQVAAKAAVMRITDKEMARLEENLRQSKQAIESGATEKMIDLDTEFHNIIYKAARSKYLYRICQNLSDHTLKFRIAAIHIPEIAKRASEDHSKIYKALKSKDPQKVEDATASHLKVVKKDVLLTLEKMREETFMTSDTGF